MNKIKKHLEMLGIIINGSLTLTTEFGNDSTVLVCDMDIMTFQKKLVAVYFKKIDTTFPAEHVLGI